MGQWGAGQAAPAARSLVFAAAWWGLGRSWWYLFVPVHTTMTIFITGHSGYHLTLDRVVPDALFLLLNPFQAVALCTANTTKPMDHAAHHLRPTTHFALFFTFWDDLLGTSAPPEPHVPLPLMALNLLWYAFLWAFAWAAYSRPAAVAAAAALHALLPLALPDALLGGRASRLRAWDALRRAYGVGYAAPGADGAFDARRAAAEVRRQLSEAAHARGGKPSEAAAQAAAVVTAMAGLSSSDSGGTSGDGGGHGAPPQAGAATAAAQAPEAAAAAAAAAEQRRFVFAYHPQGFLARGALLTFAARGARSPASALPGGVRLAAGGWMLRVPGMQQALIALGCTDASRSNLLRLLTGPEPTSVAICPGGWAEARHMGSYRLVIRRRLGFARLASEAGAALVPVLGVGEPEVTGEGGPGAVALRPRSLRVVFGDPVAPLPGEPPAALHARYLAALSALAARHGVPIEMAE
ncbi:hypothetical protein Rsub_11061 [Raphidocelis subcapitata]|uniref:Acyltransferase n=1 Tax=Raphidocelis subcapitata TaxID=307507 RepID=A0A2V0PEF7_9CHLO|nr:hypothetical protein Rsub_11061 [Raphidocelis subcapitata]|eukprot:GBF98241.1 hypothetical protein Rsub_11061 [Raphidocelis subcapitata]